MSLVDIKLDLNEDNEDLQHDDNLYSLSSTDDIEREYRRNQNPNDGLQRPGQQGKPRFRTLVKIILGLMAVTVIVILSVLLITRTSNEPTENQKDVDKFTCALHSISKTTEMKINTPISFTCQYPTSITERYFSNSRLLVNFSPNYNLSKESVELNISLQNPVIKQGPWIITTSGKIELRGNPVDCGQDGIYNITLQTPIGSFNFVIKLDIDMERTPVDLKITKTEKEGEVIVTCSFTSVCDSACLILMGIMNGRFGPLPGMTFNCSHSVDWNVNCRGYISKDATEFVDDITCRPNITNNTEADYFAAVLPKDALFCDGDDCDDFICSEESNEEYYTDPKLCRIFHRCVNGRLYIQPCPAETYWDTNKCTCSHISDVIAQGDCNSDGLRLKTGNKKILCRAKDHV